MHVLIHKEIVESIRFSILANMKFQKNGMVVFFVQLVRKIRLVGPHYKGFWGFRICVVLACTECSRGKSIEPTHKRRSISVDFVEKRPHLWVCVAVNDMHESVRALCQVGERRWNSRGADCVDVIEFAVEITSVPSLRSKFF